MKCAICDQRIKKSEAYLGDEGTLYEGKSLCESCYYEDEPAATVLYNKDKQPYIISGTRNETEGDFSVSWHSTDPWRGYYEAKSEKYALVNTAELLAYHESERMLKEFDDMFWGCRIGAPDLKEESKREMLDLYSLITNRMVIWLDVEERR